MEPAEAAPRRALIDRVLESAPSRKALQFHEANPKKAAAIFFLSGVGWDAATIFRIDSIIDNAIIIAYLAALAVLYVAATLHEVDALRNRTLLRLTRWFPMAGQFLLGALFSMFVFFYSQSASWSETSIFLVVLVGLLIANEVLSDRMFSARLRLGVLFFVMASYLVYFVPIITGRMSHLTFVAGLVLAAGVVGGIARLLWRQGVFRGQDQLAWTAAVIAVLFVFLETAYLQNWIPPVPMAVREAGIYHEVAREGDTYRMRYARPPWYRPLIRDDSEFHYVTGDTVFAYTAVFAPTRLEKRIVHVWENRPDSAWVETDRIAYVVAGGRSSGYRGYTRKRNVAPGAWRVRVETDDGRLLSRIRFNVLPRTEPVEHWKWRTD